MHYVQIFTRGDSNYVAKCLYFDYRYQNVSAGNYFFLELSTFNICKELKEQEAEMMKIPSEVTNFTVTFHSLENHLHHI